MGTVLAQLEQKLALVAGLWFAAPPSNCSWQQADCASWRFPNP